MSRRIAYLCLQVTQEGQASHAHVHEIIAGLLSRGWLVELVEPRHGASTGQGGARRALSFALAQWRLVTGPRDFDAVYVRGHFAALPTALWCRARGIPVVQEVNGPFDDVYAAWPWTRRLAGAIEWSARAQYRWATEVIAVTDGLKRLVESEVGRADVHVIANAANTDMFRPGLPRPAGLPARYAVFHGALAKWQGISTMLEAVRLPAWPSDLGLVVLGVGEEAPAVLAAARADERVVYVGRVPYSDVPGIIGSAAVGLVPKNHVGGRAETGLSPLKLYELMAAGVPVVVSDFPGQADIVRRAACGAVVAPEDPAGLAAAVREVAADSHRASVMGANGRFAAVSEHSWGARAEETARVVESAITKQRGGAR